VERVTLALNQARKPVNGSKISILGVAYKRDVDDPRESPSFELMELLAAQRAKLSYSDPHIPHLPKMRHYDVPELSSSALTKEYLAEQDCVLIVTDHSAFDYGFIAEHSRLVVDTRNALGRLKTKRATIVKA
jgi:UDP-N-acetyl-D-glucosamine dehydrogenase